MGKMLAIVTMLGACLSVDATRIRKGLYVVNVRGNALGGQGQAITAANERANELCPDGYDIQDSASDSTSAYFRTSYGVQQIRKPEVTIVVRCSQPEPERPRAPARPAQEPQVVAIARWWCVTFSGGRLGTCYRGLSACERRRAVALQTDPAASPCEPRSVVSCFGIAFPGQDGSDDMCHPTTQSCVEQRNYVLENPDQARALTDCRPID